MRAVFLHSGWRTGSTYFWNKFRQDQRCLTFYEPFNEMLATLTAAAVFLTQHPEADFHHPTLGPPVFHEYLPLLGPRGHPLFRDAFSYRNYFVTDQPLDEQRAYVETLVQSAARFRRTPILGFVRSLGRVAWMKRNFDGVNIVLIRSPLSQWMSGQRLASQHGYKFFDRLHWIILSQAQGNAAALEHARHHGIPRYEALTPAAAGLALQGMVEAAPEPKRLEVFLSVYFLSYMAALPYADVLVDIDRLSSEPDYRAKLQIEIADLTGIDLDFADVSAPRHRNEAGSALARSLEAARDAIASSQGPLWGDGAANAETRAARNLIERKLAEDGLTAS